MKPVQVSQPHLISNAVLTLCTKGLLQVLETKQQRRMFSVRERRRQTCERKTDREREGE